MVMDALGPSLEELFRKCGRKFSLKTVLMLADQMIQRVEYIHSRLYLHRDIKPDNFLMGLGKRQHYVYIIDFGLTKRYRDQKSGQHIPYKDGKSLTGTARYASINTHVGIEQSRRDDLECLGFVLIYLLKGGLPWQGVKAKTRNAKYEIIREMKERTPIQELSLMNIPECINKMDGNINYKNMMQQSDLIGPSNDVLPDEFIEYMNYCRDLKFEEKPDYNYLRRIFKDLFNSKGYEYDYVFDWQLLERKNKKKVNYQGQGIGAVR